MTTVLVVDDHPIVLQGIGCLLRQRGMAVVQATSASEAMLAIQLRPDIQMIVCDLQLKYPADGLELVKEMRAKGLRRPTVIYTLHDEPWNINRLMETDIEGIVMKGDDITELLEAIDRVSRGETYFSESYDKNRLDTLKINGILSAKTIEVLRCAASGLTVTETADKLFSSEKTVEYHRSAALKKLGCRTIGEAVSRAIKLGYID